MFTLIHTNDFHNHLNEEQVAHLTRLRSSVGRDGILLDAGDAISAGNVTFHPGGEEILRTMSGIGYDALTVGNREFHFSNVGFRSKLSNARFPVLCANIRRNGTHRTAMSSEEFAEPPLPEPLVDPNICPYIVHDAGEGWRVVIFGITVPMITERMLSRRVSAFVFDDPIRTAQHLVPALRKKYEPDLLVGLTHIGIQQDRLLASRVPGIDIIVGGHTHVVLPDGERVGDTLIVQAGGKGKYVGTVTIDRAHDSTTLSMTASLAPL